MKLVTRFFFGLLLITALFSCSSDSLPPPPKSWTFLVYLDGDNDLYPDALADLAELKMAASSPYVNIVVQLDLQGGATTKRYKIVDNRLELLSDLGELDMSAEVTITDFLTWASAAYPAERTILLLWDHGNGWDQGSGVTTPKSAPKTVASMFTDTDNNGGSAPFLPNYLIRNAIKTSGIKLDVLAFDGCSMGTIEALYEFRELADIIISSEELASVAGWDYTSVLSGLAGQPGMSVEDFGRLAVSSYRNFYENAYYPARAGEERSNTISAVRSNGLQEIADGVNTIALDLARRLDDPLTRIAALDLLAQSRHDVQEVDKYAQAFVYADLLDLATRLAPGSSLPASVAKAVLAEYHGSARPGANGIAIVFFRLPEAKSYNTFDVNYADFNQATLHGNKGEFIMTYKWDELLATYYYYAGL